MLHPGTKATGVVLSQGTHGPNGPTPWGGSSQLCPEGKNRCAGLPSRTPGKDLRNRREAEEAAKTHPRWNRGWGGGLDGPQFFAVVPAGGPPLVGGRPGGGHPECLHGCAIERQAIEQLGEVRFRAATTH